jgi:hypothetical protein
MDTKLAEVTFGLVISSELALRTHCCTCRYCRLALRALMRLQGTEDSHRRPVHDKLTGERHAGQHGAGSLSMEPFMYTAAV